MVEKTEESCIVLEPNSFEESMERGVYPHTTTSEDRYTNPASFDHSIYTGVSNILQEDPGEYVILDIASSTGEALKSMIDQLEDEYSSELRPVSLDVNRSVLQECYSQRNAEPVQGAAQQLPFTDDSIDIVVSSQLNLYDRFVEQAVEEINRVMSPEGHAVLTTGYVLDENDYRGLHSEEVTSRI